MRTASKAPAAPRTSTIPEPRARAVQQVRESLEAARKPVLTTHVNADGDGAGSEIALAHHLQGRGARVTIVNPTPFPATFDFLLDDLEGIEAYTPKDSAGAAAVEAADRFIVLDTAEPSRLGVLARAVKGRPVTVIDHHPPGPENLGDPTLVDPAAAATGELVFELIAAPGESLPLPEARALYVALVTDTGSFRFANTSQRTHQITAELLRSGVDPEEMYRHLYGQVTAERLDLLKRALNSLEIDSALPIAWITLTQNDFDESGAGSADLEGIVEHARRLRGVEVALLFRELADGSSKVSLRSNGDLSVADVARRFGGGGHEKAAGIHLSMPLDQARERVLAGARDALRAAGLTAQSP